MDEAGCSCWSPVSYSWSRQGVQKRQEQTKQRGKRVNIIGFWEPEKSLVYGLVVGKMTSDRYIRLMDWQAQQAAQWLKRTGKITVIGQDNAPIHTSSAVRERISLWQEKGLYLFHFAKYCSEMNEIETEWQRMKEDEIRGQMFEHEHDLSMEIVRAMKARGKKAGYKAQRFGFKSKRIVE
jgi:transposase